MLSLLITLLVVLLVVGVIWYVFRTMIPLPPPGDRVVNVVLVVVIVLVLIWFLLALAGRAPLVI